MNSPKFCMFYSSNYRYRLARLGCWSLLVQLIHLKLTCLKPGCSPLVNTWLGPGFRRGGGNPLERNLEGEEPVQNSSTRLSTHETVPFTVYTFAFRYSTRFQITDVVLRLYLQALSLESSTTHGSKFPKHEVV